MKTMKKRYRNAMITTIAVIAMFTAIGYGYLSAEDDHGMTYSEAGTKLTTAFPMKELRQISVLSQSGIITTCTYPQDSELPICDGFTLREAGLYTTKKLQPGSMIDHEYVPYTYELIYEDDQGQEQKESIEIARAPKTLITEFKDQSITSETQDIEISGEYDQVTFSSDDEEHVSFQGTTMNVTAGAKETILVTATDNGSGQYSGGSVMAAFTYKETLPEIKTLNEEQLEALANEQQPALLSITPNDADVWYSGENTLQVKVELVNQNHQFTTDMNGKPIPNYSVKLQAQFVNILNNEDAKDLNKDDILSNKLSDADVNKLFSKSTWISGSAIDTTLAYANPSETSEGTSDTWIQTLQVTYPKEEGIYLIRYRLWDTAAGQKVPLRISNNVYDSDDGYFDYHKIIGQDFSAPIVKVGAKRSGEDDYHELQTGELLGNGASIQIDIDAAIAGVKTQQYQFVVNGAAIEKDKWKTIPQNGIIDVPNDFGGSLEIRVSDNMDLGNKEYRTTSISKQILPPADYIVLTLPQADDRWQNITSATTWMIAPTAHTINYDGVLFTFTNTDNKQVTEKFIGKNEFIKNRYDLSLEDGHWAISARVVTRDNSDPDNPVYEAVDEKSKAETRLAIDHTASINAVKGDKKDQVYTIIVQGKSGPSGIKSVKRNVTIEGKMYTSTIKVDDTGKYNDHAQLNGSYSYTLTNNAGKEVTSSPVTIDGLNNTSPVLNVKATDRNGNEVQSGESAENYIELWAEDINPNSTKEQIQICINGSCQDYTMGDHIRIEDSAHIVFKTKDNTKVLDEFDITITGNYDLGTVTITNQNDFGDAVWLSEDASVNAKLTGGDEGVYLEANVGGAGYQPLKGTTAAIPIQKRDETTSSTLVLVRSSDGEHYSQPQRVMVNIDKLTPTLSIKQEHNQLNSQSLASFTVKTGGSGLKSAKVKHDTDTINLTIKNNTIEDYPMSDNGTYTFTITAGNGRTATESVTVTGLNENVIHVSAFVGDVDQANSYDGSWTKETVTFKLSGGLKDMNQFSKYQMKTSKGEWEDCTDTITLTDEQNETLEFQVVLKDGSTSSQTDVFPVKIDTLPPSDPLITIHKLNDNSVARFLRSITFDQFMKEGRTAEITSNDTGSGATIYYQFADAKGEFDTDLTSNKWIKYDGVITLNKEGNVAIAAYAIDEVGHHSNHITNSDGMVFDFTAPILSGVDGDSGYIPRTVKYEDSLSGLADTQVFTFNDKNMTLTQGTKLKETGNYHFEISDRAGNVTIKDFTLKAIPNPDDIDGSDETKDIIDDIKDEFDKNKGDLDDDTQKEIQDQIDDIEEAFKKQRTDHLEDKETGASLDGINDTTFPKDAILSVKRITEEVSESDRTKYEDYADQLQEKADVTDLYEVKITLDGKELALHGSATLTIKRKEETKRFAYIEEAMMKELGITNVETGFTSVIEHTGKYATLIDDQNKGGNEDEINHIEDEESGAVIDGINGTTFPKNTILRVRKITSELKEEEQNTYQMQANALSRELMDVYEVTLTCDDKPIVLTGSAELTIPMETKPDGVAFIQDHVMQERSFTMNDTNIHMEITSVGRYATLTGSGSHDPNDPDNPFDPDNPNDPNDPDNPYEPNNPNDPYDPNGGNQGDGSGNGNSGNGNSVMGSYQSGGLNTGDITNYGILFVITIMSFMILLHTRTVLHNKGDE